jgi:hypothetical protein
MKQRKPLNGSILVIVSVLGGVLCMASGCMSMKSEVQREEIDAVDNSMSLAEGNITRYDDALKRLGMLLTAHACDTVRVQVRPIENRTASKKVPADVTQMTITALNKIGPQVQIIDYDKDQLGIDLAIGTHTMERIAPDLAVRGAITEFDKKVEKERGLEAGIDASIDSRDLDSDASYDTSAEAVTMATDYQLLNYTTQTLLPGVQAVNRIDFFKAEKGGEFGINYDGSGLNFKAKVTKSQGMHSALRLLVELSIAEVLGEYYKIPYWRVVPGTVPNEAVIDEFRRAVNRRPDRLLLKKRLAYAHGQAVDPFTDSLTAHEETCFDVLRKDLGLAESTPDAEFITQMWLRIPVEKGAMRMRDYYEELARVQEQEAMRQAELQRQRAEEEARLQQAQLEQQQRQQETVQKRTTFKFGKQDTF